MAHFRKITVNGAIYEWNAGKNSVVIRSKSLDKRMVIPKTKIGGKIMSRYCSCGAQACNNHYCGWGVTPSDIRKAIISGK